MTCEQVLNLAEAANELLRLVKTGEFRLAKEVSDHLQYLIARDEALEPGHFTGEGKEQLTPGVGFGMQGRYMPPPTEAGGGNLRGIYTRGMQFIQAELNYVFEQALAYFLFASPQQFYFDGNKRTARYMMNGHLMSRGFDAISVPAARRQEFNTSMVEFFTTKDGTGMFRFLASCRAEADRGVLPGDSS